MDAARVARGCDIDESARGVAEDDGVTRGEVKRGLNEGKDAAAAVMTYPRW